jgi:hypothetical protein
LMVRPGTGFLAIEDHRAAPPKRRKRPCGNEMIFRTICRKQYYSEPEGNVIVRQTRYSLRLQ